jgi:hypothetical protein
MGCNFGSLSCLGRIARIESRPGEETTFLTAHRRLPYDSRPQGAGLLVGKHAPSVPPSIGPSQAHEVYRVESTRTPSRQAFACLWIARHPTESVDLGKLGRAYRNHLSRCPLPADSIPPGG